MHQGERFVITGAAGLVGQNLVLMLREAGYGRVVAIDKQPAKLRLLAELNPGVEVVEADLAQPGPWQQAFVGAETAVVPHPQITGETGDPCRRSYMAESLLRLLVAYWLARESGTARAPALLPALALAAYVVLLAVKYLSYGRAVDGGTRAIRAISAAQPAHALSERSSTPHGVLANGRSIGALGASRGASVRMSGELFFTNLRDARPVAGGQ